MRIILITYKENNKVYVSHGIDESTMLNVVLPNNLLSLFNARFCTDIQEYCLIED